MDTSAAITLPRSSPLSWHRLPAPETSMLFALRRAELSPTVALWHAHFDPRRFSSQHPQVQASLRAAGLATSSEKRQAEFWAGRSLMMRAFNLPTPPGRMPSGAPFIPQGCSGSLSHSSQNILLLTGPAGLRMGADIERDLAPISLQAVINRVATPTEKRWLHTLEHSRQRIAATLLFSAKEALFKAFNAEVNTHPGYAAAEAKEPPQHGTLCFELTRSLGPGQARRMRINMGYEQVNGFMLTWVCQSSM
ncbi:4'-phosphopantetheinyl transferase superfamily protein [Serratia ficaria]|uniref:4'-phosphopantetheinyl transferase family protein n=1 Tax=Serratia ficaria TaxID=61651 RepID=UPI002ED38F1B|nr:4'-phosphopantetheinyl transferase superfamily protein [Serratia ficaria]